ncbi:CHAT domain-containing protein [Aspergillus spectabilis]
MTDLEESIKIGQQAIKAIPEDHPDRAMCLHSLGIRLGAISHQQSALQQQTSFITTRIQAGRYALRSLAILSNWQQGYEVADIAVHLIPRLTSRSLENSDKQHLLAEVVGLASDAAAAALNAQKGALIALNLLEQGRGMLAASLEEVRTDILDLQQTYPLLAEQFVQLRNILDKPVTRNNHSVDMNHESSWQAQAGQRYKADKDFDKLLVEIRKQPGFDDFLQAPSEEEMRLAAHDGPIVTINISQYRCDAIIVTQNKICFLPLPNLKSEEIREKAEKGDLGSSIVLEWLWDNITHPVLEALGFTQSPSDSNWPHVWWILTWPLSKFPLHAAGYHGRGNSETVLDRVMSSYSSSVKAITHGRRRPAKQLPFAAEEVKILHGLCKSMGLDPIQPKEYKRDIIPFLPQSRVFQFAGHGHTNNTDPSKSYLLLGDGKDNPFTVANLLEINLREHSPFLAYLSACGTGRIGDEKFIDESIHLISAFQLAGFRHVIGTLWEVYDKICVDMAKITYEEMAGGNMTDEAKDKTKIESVDGNSRLPRDIVPCDSNIDGDDVNGTRELLWVPYVHYGV